MSTDPLARIFYVYVIFYINGIPYYVGKGKRSRATSHIINSHNKQLRSLFKKHGDNAPIVILRDKMTEPEAFALEILLIKTIGRLDIGTGPLVNHTDGGEGTTGWVPTPETLAKLGQHLKGKSLSETHRAKLRGYRESRKWSEERRQHMSLKFTGDGNPLFGKRNPKSEEARLRLSQTNKGKKPSDKCLEAARQSHLGKPVSAYVSERRLAAVIGVPKSDSHKKAISRAVSEFIANNPYIMITNDIISKRHPKDSPIPDGWRRGRAVETTSGYGHSSKEV